MPSRILRQYAAIFFFAPLIQQRLRGHNFGLSEDDHQAINNSVRRGYAVFILGISFLVISVLRIFYDWTALIYLYRGLMGTTLISIMIGIWRIHRPSADYKSTSSVITNHMLMAFLPGYNRYLWYTQQDPHHPYRWLKESILWRYVIMVCLLIPGVGFIGVVLLVLMIIRIIILAAGYDIIPSRTKQWLNRHYTQHADEWWSFIDGGMVWLGKHSPYISTVHEYKKHYHTSLPSSLTQWSMLDKISYTILCILLVILLWIGWNNRAYAITMPTVFRGFGLLITYYVIRHQSVGLGRVPIIHTIISLITAKISHPQSTDTL